MSAVKDLTKGSPMKLILGFMLPMLLGLLFQQFYNMVDTIVVGQFLGVNALAGVGSTGSVNFLVLGFCMGVCAGFAIPVAQKFGVFLLLPGVRRFPSEIRKTLTDTSVLAASPQTIPQTTMESVKDFPSLTAIWYIR